MLVPTDLPVGLWEENRGCQPPGGWQQTGRWALSPTSRSWGAWPAAARPPPRCSSSTASPRKKKSVENRTLACLYLGTSALRLIFPLRASPLCSTSEASGTCMISFITQANSGTQTSWVSLRR